MILWETSVNSAYQEAKFLGSPNTLAANKAPC